MANSIIDKILDVEKSNSVNLDNAKANAEKMIDDARDNAKKYYNDELLKAKEKYEKVLSDAKKESDNVVLKAEEAGQKEKEAIISELKSKQSKAIEEIIKNLI